MYKNPRDKELNLLLEQVYAALDSYVKASGLTYDFDTDEYIFTNVEEDDCDREMKASIENAHTDLTFYLGKG